MHNTTPLSAAEICQIDMFTPAETCDELQVVETQLLDLVNSGRLAAYDLGGNIRFKMVDVFAVQQDLVAA